MDAKTQYLNQKPKIGYKLMLTPREREVVDQVLTGKTNKIIGEKLGVTEKTIKFHLTSIYKKLNVKSRHEMIVKEANKKGKRLFTNNI